MDEQERKELRQDLDRFFNASRCALCHVYPHADGFFPDECNCELIGKAKESLDLLMEERKRLLKKYNL